MVAACGTAERRAAPTAPTALALHASAAPTAEGCLIDPGDCPPDAWIFSPDELNPHIPQDASNCDFALFGVPAPRNPNVGMSS